MIETTWDGLAVARDKPYGASILVWRRARGGPRVAGSPSRSSRARLRRGLGLDATGRRASARRGSPPLCRARTPRGDGPHAPTDRDGSRQRRVAAVRRRGAAGCGGPARRRARSLRVLSLDDAAARCFPSFVGESFSAVAASLP